MKKRYAMVIDSSKCINCRACVVSCQLTNGVPPMLRRNWIHLGPHEGGAGVHYQPGNCMQCDRPTCVEACPTGATYQDKADGVVKVNRRLCIGCGSCIPACPYGARYRHPVDKVVDKCDFCSARVSRGAPPACVETCPTNARVFGDISDEGSLAARLLKDRQTVRVVNRTTDTQPAIYYLDKTSPMDWPVEARPPEAIRLWKDIFNPAVKGIVGLSGLGVLVMLGKQLLASEPPHLEAKKKGAGKAGHAGKED